MKYAVLLSRRFERDMDGFFEYAATYSDRFSREQLTRLRNVIDREIATNPNVWATFYLTGEPYRAYLFRVGRRTSYWIVYRVDPSSRSVVLMRLWNASRRPSSFRVR